MRVVYVYTIVVVQLYIIGKLVTSSTTSTFEIYNCIVLSLNQNSSYRKS